MNDSEWIEDLRRRVRLDPASIAFAQLAEELRRAGQWADAVETCRAGLAMHPSYAAARVTLARALIELNELEAATSEIERAVADAPDNVRAIRTRADIYQRRGRLSEALAQYQLALSMTRGDPVLAETVSTLLRQVDPAAAERERDRRTIEALEQWLDAIHVARADARA